MDDPLILEHLNMPKVTLEGPVSRSGKWDRERRYDRSTFQRSKLLALKVEVSQDPGKQKSLETRKGKKIDFPFSPATILTLA